MPHEARQVPSWLICDVGQSSRMPPLLIVILVLVGALIAAAVVSDVAVSRRRRERPLRDYVRPTSRERSIPHPEVPLSDRKVSMKICSDCRELVLLEAACCKYCGCTFDVEASQKPNKAPEPTPGLVTPRALE